MAGKLKARPALATNLSSSRVSTKDGSLARLPFSLRRLCAVALSSMVSLHTRIRRPSPAQSKIILYDVNEQTAAIRPKLSAINP